MVEQVSEAVIAVEGEPLRAFTDTVITETPSGEWAIGGQSLTAEDVRGDGRDRDAGLVGHSEDRRTRRLRGGRAALRVKLLSARIWIAEAAPKRCSSARRRSR